MAELLTLGEKQTAALAIALLRRLAMLSSDENVSACADMSAADLESFIERKGKG